MATRHLITIGDLTNREIEEIFNLADLMEARGLQGPEGRVCAGKIMATLFYEPSTRTRLSFESAMQRLGGSVISCPDMRSSSTAKGESIADTAKVVSSYADLLVVRHHWDGAVQAMGEHADVPVINAGDGSHEHPTQTLCDLYTLRKEKRKLKGLTVVICGDLKHGRTIHSLVYALARFGVHVIILAARGMELPQYVLERLEVEYHYSLAPVPSDDLRAVVTATDAVYLTPSQPHQLALFTQTDPVLQSQLSQWVAGLKFDAFYVTRQQKERAGRDSPGKAGEYPRIGERFLRERRFRDTVVMHPLPRVDELSQAVDKDRRGIYFKQAAYGVPIRMALLKFLFGAAGASRGGPIQKRLPRYVNPEPIGAQCPNGNCVTRREIASTRPSFEMLFTAPGTGLILRCGYCDHQLKVGLVGHTTTRRYCAYEPPLGETVREWLRSGALVLFDSIKQAEELGYEPYRTGPQRTLMDGEEIRDAIHHMAEMIASDTDPGDRLVILGIRTKGVFLARRLAERLGGELARKVTVGEIEIYATEGSEIRELFPSASDPGPMRIKDRPVVLVDDVIHTGRTAKNALSIIFKSGRPLWVRLAVLIDRGHREVPVKPNYVGKHIPSSERERVRVKLREVEKDEKDKVVIYSMIGPPAPAREKLSV